MELQLAFEYQSANMFEKAKEHFQNLINYEPDPYLYNNLQEQELGSCYFGIGFYYFQMEEYDKALSWLQEGRIAAPYFYDNYKLAVDIYCNMKLYHRAKDLMMTALNLCTATYWCNMFDITGYEPYFTLAKIFAQEEDYISALGYLTLSDCKNQGEPNMDIYYLRNQVIKEQFDIMNEKVKNFVQELNEAKILKDKNEETLK